MPMLVIQRLRKCDFSCMSSTGLFIVENSLYLAGFTLACSGSIPESSIERTGGNDGKQLSDRTKQGVSERKCISRVTQKIDRWTVQGGLSSKQIFPIYIMFSTRICIGMLDYVKSAYTSLFSNNPRNGPAVFMKKV